VNEGVEVILTQHYLACLSHASYLIGDETTGRLLLMTVRMFSRSIWPRT